MDLHDEPGQVPVFDLPGGGLTFDGLVVGGRRHFQDPAGHRDGEPVRGQFLDQPDHCFGRMFSRAK